MRRQTGALVLLLQLVGATEDVFHAEYANEVISGSLRAHSLSSTSSSCASHSTCTDCAVSSTFCHWCDKDQACHAVGSPHGCVYGSSCTNHSTPPPAAHNDSCSAFTSCGACALSSRLCHWCAHDQACHAVGSVYGCISGVDCYSNDRCRRAEPEPLSLDERHAIHAGIIPFLIVVAIGLVACCCVSLCFLGAGCVKGAYDDLALLSLQTSRQNHPYPPIDPHEVEESLEEAEPPEVQERTQEDPQGDDEDGNEESTPLLGQDGQVGETVESNYALMDDELAPTASSPVAHSRAASQNGLRKMQRMYNACAFCYVLAVIGIFGCVASVIRFLPSTPVYNVCNDKLAWKSIVDGMASIQTTADFEILISVSNPNYVDVSLDMGSGTFQHEGALVGTFEIPPETIGAMAITDVVMIAHFTPEMWDALSLTKEYYRGKLVLSIDSKISVRIPSLFNYAFQVEMDDMLVNVNEMSDRSLCACPDWDEAKNTTLLF